MAYKRHKLKERFASRFMDTVGDGTGSIDANVNGSVTPVHFFIKPEPGHMLLMYRAMIHLTDTGSLDSGGFGNGAALTNGLEYGLWNIAAGDFSGPRVTSQKPIVKNMDLAAFAFDLTVHTWGLGDEGLTARYTFDEDGEVIVIPDGYAFALRVQDNLTTLTEFVTRIGCTQIQT